MVDWPWIVSGCKKAGAELINTIKSSKENVYNNLVKKLNDPNSSSETYWSITRTFVNGKKLLFYHYWSIIT